MSSMINSQGMALAATAMAAVSGTVILLSFCIQKPIPIHHADQFSPPILRSCIPSETRKTKKKKKTTKRVHFAEDVVDPIGNGEDFRKRYEISTTPPPRPRPSHKAADRGLMPANRVALYNGILRDRGVHRYSC